MSFSLLSGQPQNKTTLIKATCKLPTIFVSKFKIIK